MSRNAAGITPAQLNVGFIDRQGAPLFLQGKLFEAVASTAALVSSTTETSLFNTAGAMGQLMLPPRFLETGVDGNTELPTGTGRSIRIRLVGRITNTGTPTLRIRALIGTQVIFDSTAVAMATITGTSVFELDIYATIRVIGSGTTGKIESSGKYSYQAAALGAPSEARVAPAQANIDTTIAGLLDVLATWGASSASNSLIIDQAYVEVLG